MTKEGTPGAIERNEDLAFGVGVTEAYDSLLAVGRGYIENAAGLPKPIREELLKELKLSDVQIKFTVDRAVQTMADERNSHTLNLIRKDMAKGLIHRLKEVAFAEELLEKNSREVTGESTSHTLDELEAMFKVFEQDLTQMFEAQNKSEIII